MKALSIVVTVALYGGHICLAFPTLKQSKIQRVLQGAGARALQQFDVIFEERDLDSDAITSVSGTDAAGGFVNKRSYEAAVTGNGPLKFLLTPLFFFLEEGPGSIFSSIFLPTGFAPGALTEYLQYQRWNLLQDACSYLRGIMGTQALLVGMGVGRSDMSALQATVQWVLRDGASMIGGLLFTSFFSANFGQNVKSWRLFADFINNVGITLDIIAPLTGEHFLIVVCIASIFKALCGVAAGATNAVIGAHWGAKNGNMADVMAKNGAQHTLVNLFGLAFSVKFAKFVSVSAGRMWTTYGILTAVHMISNMRAMRVLALTSLNLARYQLLMQRFLRSSAMQDILQVVIRSSTGKSKEGDQQLFESAMGQLDRGVSTQLSPASVARAEPLLSLIAPQPFKAAAHVVMWVRIQWVKMRLHWAANDQKEQYSSLLAYLQRNMPTDTRSSSQLDNICLWASPAVVSTRFTKKEISDRMLSFSRLNYFIISTDDKEQPQHPEQRQKRSKAQIYVCFRKGATMKDQAKAAFEACVYDLTGTTASARQITLNTFPLFWEAVEQNAWDVNRLQLRPRVARVFSSV